MQAVQETLAQDVDRVRAELELYDVLSDALKARYAEDVLSLREYDRRARRSTYANTIVGCYGLIEQTIDSMLVSIAEAFLRFYDRHDEIPLAVRNQHRELLLQCLRDGERARTRNQISERAALEALGRAPEDPALLLSSVFTLSTANYRLPYTQTLFKRLGVDILTGLAIGAPTELFEKSGFANFESFIEDLVQRRNDLAHSYGDDNIVDPELLSTYVDIVSSYLSAVERVADLSLVRLLAENKLEPIGKVVATWTGRIGVRLTAGSVAVGDQLLLLKDDWCTSHAVTSLQSEGTNSAEFVFDGTSIDVSASVENVPSKAEHAVAYKFPPLWQDFWPSEYRQGAS